MASDDLKSQGSSEETPTKELTVPDGGKLPVSASSAKPPPPPPPTDVEDEDDDDGDDEGMLRMSFLEHLEELRLRIIRALIGVGVAFVASLAFTQQLWSVIQAPATAALQANGITTGLAFTKATEPFSVIWVKLPILSAIFISSPWVLYQVWAFIAPGLYKRERRWAMPFVLTTAGLFILGGLFAYFVAFKLGLAFLLGIGVGSGITPVVTITDYFDLFVNVSLGLGIVFELPVLIFFLTLLRIVTPQFLIRNSRYAILIIVIAAAILTPTPDAINLMIMSVPMTALYFGGVFAAYLLALRRDQKRFPWLILLLIVAGFLAICAGGIYLALTRYGYTLTNSFPFLVR